MIMVTAIIAFLNKCFNESETRLHIIEESFKVIEHSQELMEPSNLLSLLFPVEIWIFALCTGQRIKTIFWEEFVQPLCCSTVDV